MRTREPKADPFLEIRRLVCDTVHDDARRSAALGHLGAIALILGEEKGKRATPAELAAEEPDPA